MVTQPAGYPFTKKVTLFLDRATQCNDLTSAVQHECPAQVAQVVILIRINIYILFSVVVIGGWCPRQ